MKATLEFNLDDPDDRQAHLRCVKSLDMAIALFDIINNADRNVNTVEEYQDRINTLTMNINLDELIS